MIWWRVAAMRQNAVQQLVNAKCTRFVGSSSQYVTLGDVLGFERSTAVSISFWIKWTSTSYQVLISKQNAAQVGFVIIANTSGQIEVNLQNTWASSCIFVRTVEAGFNDDGWHHVAISYSGSSTAAGVLIYVDGQAKTKETVYDSLTTTIVNNASLWFGGRDTGANPYHATADLDEIAFYNIALSAGQVTALYNGGTPTDLRNVSSPPPASLTGWWRMGDGDTHPTLTDRSTGGHNGTMTNMSAGSIVAR